jgi:hypothetical protein
MSSTDRQNNLLVAQNWQKIYQSFKNADFTSYDFNNLRRTMIEYIRNNYPEDFNDYIESSEYLALIDVIAYVGQSIAFRVDLNARENFLELAERRDSILRLARMISYNANRNTSAKGLLKFTSVSTTESVIDSNGRDLTGQTITWNDSANLSWNDQFIRIINAAVPDTQQFGNPTNTATIYGIATQQYRFQASNTDVPVYNFTKTVAGTSMDFEITSTTFSGQDFIYEEPPLLGNHLGFVYRDDGKGAGSANSGFFLNFTQGTLNQGTFGISQPSTSESVNIDVTNINNTDVWLYSLDSTGLENNIWTQVPSLAGNNIIYNSLNKNIKNIYQVVSRAGDRISINFSDGTFGNLPLGNFRVYYRTSNGLTYTINPTDFRSITIDVLYLSRTNNIETLSITLSLQLSVSNSGPTESNTSIKTNAPQVYYTQNRMITGEDYNISPLTVSNEVAKVKAVNRTSSGISRYFDLTDPTGKYSATNLFATDGVIYQENFTNQTTFSYATQTDIEGIIYNIVFPILKLYNVRNFYYSNFLTQISNSLAVTWKSVTNETGLSTGYITDTNSIVYKVGSFTSNNLQYVTTGSLIKFVAPNGYYFDKTNSNKLTSYSYTIPEGGVSFIWAQVVSVVNDGTASGTGTLSTGLGPISFNTSIPTGSVISEILPKWRTVIDSSVITTMIDLIFSNKPFGLRYNIVTQSWQIIFESNLNISSSFSLSKQGDTTNQQQDASWFLLFTTNNEYYTITSRQQRYIFESDSQISFYYDSSNKIYDSNTDKVVTDNINILNINTVPDNTIPFTTDLLWDVVSEFTGKDGYIDSKKLVITFADTTNSGIVDNPELFLNIVNPPAIGETDQTILQKKYIVEQKYFISLGQEDYKYVDNSSQLVIILPNENSVGSLTQYNDGQYFYFVDTGVVKQLNLTTSTLNLSLDYKLYVGRDNLKFQYTHSADYESRVDPGPSNIIDIYVLTVGYDTQFRNWISGANISKPLPPSSDELYNAISPTLNLIKSISDEVIYHPVVYKILFGANAVSELQANFKVVKNPSQVISDNEIQAGVLSAMNRFFALNNWDFGDTFYFTELATYVVTQLSPYIVSFVIVPVLTTSYFGSLYEIKSADNELVINGATVDNIFVVSGLTSNTLNSVPGNILNSSITQQNITSSSYGATNG